MNQSITSINELYEKQMAEHPEWTPAASDKIYVVHGTGSDRDRVFDLETLGTYILNSADGFEFSESASGGAVKTTTVNSDGIEVKIEFGSGSQEQSKTTTIDFESVTTETVKAKNIQGMTASGAQNFKLVCTTGLDVGSQDNAQPLHVNGSTTLNGNTTVNGDTAVNGNTTIGSAGTNKNLTVNGNIEATGLATLPKIDAASALKVPFIYANANQTSQLPHTDITTRQGETVGNIIVVVNKWDSARHIALYKRTDVEYDAFVRVDVKSGHSVMLICTAVDTTVPSGSSGASSWSALSDVDYDGV